MKNKLLNPHFPISPRRFPFYYGWFIIPLSVMAVISSIPGQTAGFSPFTEPLIHATGVSRTYLSLTYLFGTLSSGLIILRVSRYVDKIGIRRVMLIVCTCFALMLFGFSQITVLGGFFKVLFPSEWQLGVYLFLLTFFIFGIRFFGQGLLPIIGNTMVGKWFDQRRGLATGVMGVVNGLAFSSAPFVMNKLVEASSWQHAWLMLALIIGLGVLLIGWLFFRESPEHCDMSVSEERKQKHTLNQTKKSDELQGYTLSQAHRHPAFWAIAIIIITYAGIITGVTFHIVAIGEAAGLTSDMAYSIFIKAFIIGLPLGFLAAWSTDRFNPKFLIMIAGSAQVLTYVAYFFLSSSFGYIGVIVFQGIAGGLFGPLVSACLPKYFGRKYLGSINGRVTALMVIGSAMGPAILSFFKEQTGSFSIGIIVFAIIPFIGFLLAFFIPKPQGDQPPSE
jgi:MFS transporter, OFA family, oxalate/formate antiporter